MKRNKDGPVCVCVCLCNVFHSDSLDFFFNLFGLWGDGVSGPVPIKLDFPSCRSCYQKCVAINCDCTKFCLELSLKDLRKVVFERVCGKQSPFRSNVFSTSCTMCIKKNTRMGDFHILVLGNLRVFYFTGYYIPRKSIFFRLWEQI